MTTVFLIPSLNLTQLIPLGHTSEESNSSLHRKRQNGELMLMLMICQGKRWKTKKWIQCSNSIPGLMLVWVSKWNTTTVSKCSKLADRMLDSSTTPWLHRCSNIQIFSNNRKDYIQCLIRKWSNTKHKHLVSQCRHRHKCRRTWSRRRRRWTSTRTWQWSRSCWSRTLK